MKCPHCQHDIAVHSNSCPNCGGFNPVPVLITAAIMLIGALIMRMF